MASREGTIKLGDIAVVAPQYSLDNGSPSTAAYRHNDTATTSPAILLSVNVSDKADLTKYDKKLKALIASRQQQFSKYTLVTIVDNAEASRQQVSEITSGMFGEKWNSLHGFGYIGFISAPSNWCFWQCWRFYPGGRP